VKEKKIALILMGAFAFFHGIFMIWARSSNLAAEILFPYLVMQIFVGLFLVFLWLRGDENESRHHRSAMTNIGIAALAAVVIPIYLYRTRPSGRKAKAIALFFLVFPALFACTFVGGIVGALLFGLPKA
jgi:hypothetical protein